MPLCPQCHREVYDRTKPVCGYCGADLPPELLFTAEEIERKIAEDSEFEAKYAEWRRQEQERKERELREAQGGGVMVF